MLGCNQGDLCGRLLEEQLLKEMQLDHFKFQIEM